MREVEETPVGLVLEGNIAAWFKSRFTADVPGKKVKKNSRRKHLRNKKTLEITKICKNHAVSADERPLLLYRAVDESITVGQALDQKIKAILEKYPKFRPAHWDDLDERLRAAYYQKAVQAQGEGYALSLNIAPHMLKKALRKGGLDYLYRALRRHLQKHLGRSVDFYVVLETTCTKTHGFREARPHLHGAIICQEREKRRVHRAFRAFNRGASPVFSNTRQSELKKFTDGFNWSQYCLKSLGSRKTIFCEIPGPNVCCPHSLRREAKRLYDIDRQTTLELINNIKARLAQGHAPCSTHDRDNVKRTQGDLTPHMDTQRPQAPSVVGQVKAGGKSEGARESSFKPAFSRSATPVAGNPVSSPDELSVRPERIQKPPNCPAPTQHPTQPRNWTEESLPGRPVGAC